MIGVKNSEKLHKALERSGRDVAEDIKNELNHGLANDHSFGVNCPGCEDDLTVHNAGGYRTYCQKCVESLGPPPKGGGYPAGKYPNLHWETPDCCIYCDDGGGVCIYPHYGVAPHKCNGYDSIGTAVALPKSDWPENFEPDPEALGTDDGYPGCGTYTHCLHCGNPRKR